MMLRRLCEAGVLAAAAAVVAALCLTAGMPAASASTVVTTIPVGPQPNGVSSDGTHVWVTNYNSDSGNGGTTVTELDAATGAVVNTIPVASDGLAGASSDGIHVWVTNYYSDTVTELDAATGAVVNTIPVASDGLAGASSDGTHVWVTNIGGGTVTELNALTTQTISFTGPGTGTVGGHATLTATGGASGNPVTFTVDPSSTTGACAVSGTDGATVTYTGPGTCVIDANQAAGNGYAAAPRSSSPSPSLRPQRTRTSPPPSPARPPSPLGPPAPKVGADGVPGLSGRWHCWRRRAGAARSTPGTAVAARGSGSCRSSSPTHRRSARRARPADPGIQPADSHLSHPQQGRHPPQERKIWRVLSGTGSAGPALPAWPAIPPRRGSRHRRGLRRDSAAWTAPQITRCNASPPPTASLTAIRFPGTAIHSSHLARRFSPMATLTATFRRRSSPCPPRSTTATLSRSPGSSSRPSRPASLSSSST